MKPCWLEFLKLAKTLVKILQFISVCQDKKGVDGTSYKPFQFLFLMILFSVMC